MKMTEQKLTFGTRFRKAVKEAEKILKEKGEIRTSELKRICDKYDIDFYYIRVALGLVLKRFDEEADEEIWEQIKIDP